MKIALLTTAVLFVVLIHAVAAQSPEQSEKAILGLNSTKADFNRAFGAPSQSGWALINQITVCEGSAVLFKPHKIYMEGYFRSRFSTWVYYIADRPFLIHYYLNSSCPQTVKYPVFDQALVDPILAADKADDNWKWISKNLMISTSPDGDREATVFSQHNELREIGVYDAKAVKELQ